MKTVELILFGCLMGLIFGLGSNLINQSIKDKSRIAELEKTISQLNAPCLYWLEQTKNPKKGVKKNERIK